MVIDLVKTARSIIIGNCILYRRFLLIGNVIKSGEDSQTDLSITEALLYNGSVEVVRTFTAVDDKQSV